ncbi:MAG: hypothetical protein WCD18_26050 [Thermosynechococcaceae cyanobacterium]
MSYFKHVIYRFLAIAPIASLAVLSPVLAQPNQALTEDWRSSDYTFNSVMLDLDASNNVYALGDSPATNVLNIKKLNAAGTLLWQKIYNPVENLKGAWIAVDGNGDVVVFASTIRSTDGQGTGWIIQKYDTNGNLLWSDSVPGLFSRAVRVQVDASNNIYAVGSNFNNVLLIKYSPAGARLWSATYDNNGAIDQPSSVVISPDNTRIGVSGSSGRLLLALMYDADGNRLWAKTSTTLGASGNLAFGAGNVSYFGTAKDFFPGPTRRMAILKLDAAGKQSWLKSYDVGTAIARLGVDPQGNILATGIAAAGYTDWMTLKTNANGKLLWSQRYDGGKYNDETPNGLLIDAAGSVYVTGTGGPNPSSGTLSNLKGVIAKYNSKGKPQWAVWDDYAGGKAIHLGTGNTIAALGWGYFVASHYTQTGLLDRVPNTPTHLTFVGGSNFTFKDNATNEFWVDIERCLGAGCTNFVKIGQTKGENATSVGDTTVSPGVTYRYRVRAQGFMGPSGYSNLVEVVVPSVIPRSAPGTVHLYRAPSNLIAKPLRRSIESQPKIQGDETQEERLRPLLNKSQIRLIWSNHSNNQMGVKIERCQGSNCTDFVPIADVTGRARTYIDSGLTIKTGYRYRVRAYYDGDGYSPYSNISSTKTLR